MKLPKAFLKRSNVKRQRQSTKNVILLALLSLLVFPSFGQMNPNPWLPTRSDNKGNKDKQIESMEEKAMQNVMILKEYYYSIKSHPETIANGWHNVLETNNSSVRDARVYVLDNKITKHSTMQGVERMISEPANISKSCALIKFEQNLSYNLDCEHDKILFIYFIK